MCLEFWDSDYTRENRNCNVCARNNSWTVRTRELQVEDLQCTGVMRGAVVPSVTLNMFMVTSKARKSQALRQRITIAQFVQASNQTVEVTISIAHDSLHDHHTVR